MFISGSLELPFLDGHIDGKAKDTINQCGHDSHERDYGSPAQGSDRRLAQDGIVFLEGAVGSFGWRAQAVQPAVTFGASGNFQKQAEVLGNRDMGGKAKLFRAMGAIPVEVENGRVFGLGALLEAGKGQPLSGGIPSIGTRGKVAV